MQTFAPYPDTAQNVAVLEENAAALTIVTAVSLLAVDSETVSDKSLDAWAGHPELRKWRDHELFLIDYALRLITKVQESLDPEAEAERLANAEYAYELGIHFTNYSSGSADLSPPAWFGDADVHTSEQAALLRLYPLAYREHFPTVNIRGPLLFPKA